MNTDLTGKQAVVCSSTQGIGKAAAMELVRSGDNVTLIARNKKIKIGRYELPGNKTNKLIVELRVP